MNRLKEIGQWVVLSILACAVLFVSVRWIIETRALAEQGATVYRVMLQQQQQQRQAGASK